MSVLIWIGCVRHETATQTLEFHAHLRNHIITYIHAEYLDETIAGARRDVFSEIVQLRIVDRGLVAGLELAQHGRVNCCHLCHRLTRYGATCLVLFERENVPFFFFSSWNQKEAHNLDNMTVRSLRFLTQSITWDAICYHVEGSVGLRRGVSALADGLALDASQWPRPGPPASGAGFSSATAPSSVAYKACVALERLPVVAPEPPAHELSYRAWSAFPPSDIPRLSFLVWWPVAVACVLTRSSLRSMAVQAMRGTPGGSNGCQAVLLTPTRHLGRPLVALTGSSRRGVRVVHGWRRHGRRLRIDRTTCGV